MKRTLTATTSHGTFSRTTEHDYTHVTVRRSADGSIAATWHKSKSAALGPGRKGAVIEVVEVDSADEWVPVSAEEAARIEAEELAKVRAIGGFKLKKAA